MQNYYTPHTQKKKRKTRRHRSFASVMMTIVLCAALCVIGIFAVIYFAGVRYITVKVSDDVYVKFLGLVDDDGSPYKGRIIYSDGISAEVNLERKQITYSNGDIYEGELNANLLKEGDGKILYANGDVYEGSFARDAIHGEGTYTYVNGDVYKGTFSAGVKEGSGIYTFADGSVYSGTFSGDKKHGAGEYRFASGDTFVGTY